MIGIEMTELVRDAGFLLSLLNVGELLISVALLYSFAAAS